MDQIDISDIPDQILHVSYIVAVFVVENILSNTL